MAPKKTKDDSAETPPSTAPVLKYVDRPELAETFADSINRVLFDGQNLRIEFGVTRLDEFQPNEQVTGRRYPASRVVLTTPAAIELINRIQQIASALTEAGIAKPAAPTSKG